jgi:hypothetical protein
MDYRHDESFAQVESSFCEHVRRAGGGDPEAVVIVSDLVSEDIRGSGARGAAMLSVISALADGTARGAAQADASIQAVAVGFMIGAMRGAQETSARTLIVVGHAADSFLRHAHQSGFDSMLAARGLVEGAVDGSGGCQVGRAAAAAAAAIGAVGAADDIAASLGRKVRVALTRAPIAGETLLLLPQAEKKVPFLAVLISAGFRR